MQLVARYMPTDRPQHRAELLRKLVLYRFKTTSVADFEAAFAGLRELHDQARDVDPSRTEADFDAAVLVSIQNTPALAGLYQILDATGPPLHHAADHYFSKVRSFLENAIKHSAANPRQLEPTGLATGRFSGANRAAQPPPCVMCRFALGTDSPLKYHPFGKCPVILSYWEKHGKPGEAKQANLADAADVDEPPQTEPVVDADATEKSDALDGYPDLLRRWLHFKFLMQMRIVTLLLVSLLRRCLNCRGVLHPSQTFLCAFAVWLWCCCFLPVSLERCPLCCHTFRYSRERSYLFKPWFRPVPTWNTLLWTAAVTSPYSRQSRYSKVLSRLL